MSDNYYDILGIEKSASQKEITSAFRKLARKHHPDVNPGDTKAEESLRKIEELQASMLQKAFRGEI